ncbi:MAG: molecular chaperone TorD family protein [Eggerthellaceae bacterium]|nr:molecular chaperone TorD family protein [Eggerthellaceae bacterium]
MEDAAVFSTLAQCFGPVDEGAWDELTEAAQWDEFLDGARRLLQDDRPLGAKGRIGWTLAGRRPLQDFLCERELSALLDPPSYEARRAFAARHFTGGLPESAVPVESLYRPEVPTDPATPRGGAYLGEAALYVRDVIAGLGLEVPADLTACPDHLSLELDLVAVLLRSGMDEAARAFVAERFGWLTAYRTRLLALGDEASFYLALIDLIMGIRAQQEPYADYSSIGCATDSVA